MTKKPRPKPTPTRKGRLNTAATLAGALPLAFALLPAALKTASPATTKPNAPAKTVASAPLFKPGCELPFEDIKTPGLDVDEQCTSDGNAGDNTAKRLENNAKNNFCAQGTPVPIVYADFTNLQKAADDVDDLNLKTSRKALLGILSEPGKPKLGEGKLVQFVAFVLKAHPSNVGQGKGESVNCKLPTKDDNDIHIELTMDLADDDPCDAVTAEMSPHFRPEAWNGLVGLGLKRPVRITGPLFFDDSHQPCRDGKRQAPMRISVWEIHPVYQFEVCNVKLPTLQTCDIHTNSQWTPLDKWASGDTEP